LLSIEMLKISKQQQARLAKVLIRARQEANLTQDQLTDRLGAADAFINKIENGKRSVGFFEFYTIVKAMDQDPIKLAREIWDGDA
jgi:transcriptional regulator with XRE-family HTH domain